jgi:hypothetical protein
MKQVDFVDEKALPADKALGRRRDEGELESGQVDAREIQARNNWARGLNVRAARLKPGVPMA